MKSIKLYELSSDLFIIGTLFWISETIYFLINFGWHWTAINEHEHNCDVAVQCIFAGAFALLVPIVFRMIRDYCEQEKPNP